MKDSFGASIFKKYLDVCVPEKLHGQAISTALIVFGSALLIYVVYESHEIALYKSTHI